MSKQLAKQLYKKIFQMSRLPYNSEIKARYPNFKASNQEHWQLLILKLLGYDRKANKVHPAIKLKKTPDEITKKLISDLSQLGIHSSSRECYPHTKVSFYSGRQYIGKFGYSYIRKEYSLDIANTPRITNDDGQLLADKFFKGCKNLHDKDLKNALIKKYTPELHSLMDVIFDMTQEYYLLQDMTEIFELELAEDLTKGARFNFKICGVSSFKSGSDSDVIHAVIEFLETNCQPKQRMKEKVRSRLNRGYRNA